MNQRLLILGASARAAAFSARRAGCEPLAADLFADADLSAACRAVRVDRFPDGLADAARSLPPAPWMYTGALENRPDLIERIAAVRRLWGNGGAVVAAVRDPEQLAAALRGAGLWSPEISLAPPRASHAAAAHPPWLEKPLRSAGGRGIRLLSAAAPAAAAGGGPPR